MNNKVDIAVIKEQISQINATLSLINITLKESNMDVLRRLRAVEDLVQKTEISNAAVKKYVDKSKEEFEYKLRSNYYVWSIIATIIAVTVTIVTHSLLVGKF